MERRQYVERVADRLKAMLDAETRLPCKFVIAGGWTAQTDGPIDIYLDPEAPTEVLFEGSEVFAEILRRLNDEFSKDPWYFGIKISVPHHFLGQKFVEEIQQQAADNEKYRRSWLHGRRKNRDP